MKIKTLLSASFTILVIVLSSCGDKTKPADSMLVPEDKLVEILADTYLGDGLMDVKQVRDMYAKRDSTTNYLDILHHYGYTYQQVDSTLKYYFLYKPKKLEKIYDKVTGKLLELEAKATSEKKSSLKPNKENLWNGKSSYTFPEGSITYPIAFEIPVKEAGIYSFRAKYQIFRDDESVDPEIIISFSSKDESGKEIKINWDVYKLIKDGKPHMIELHNTLEKPHDSSIKGWLFSQSKTGTEWKKHARIMEIKFIRESAPEKEDE